MRQWGLGILALGALWVIIAGWPHLWIVYRGAGPLAGIGWVIGMAGIALLAGRRVNQRYGRFWAGILMASLGMALLAVPSDGQGILTGLRVGFGGALLAILPHTWRLYCVRRRNDDRHLATESLKGQYNGQS